MANKYTRKGQKQIAGGEEDLAKPDEFVSFWQRAYDWAKPRSQQASVIVGGVVLAIGLAWGGATWASYAREDATSQFDRAVRIYNADLVDSAADKDAKAAAEKLGVKTDKNADPDVPRFATAKERAEATIAQLATLEKDHGMTSVAKQAKLMRAGVLYDLGNYNEALALYQDVSKSLGKDDSLRAVADEGVGVSHEALGQADQAADVYRALAGTPLYKDRALYNLGRVLYAKGDKEGAKKAWQDLLTGSPDTTLRDEVANRLSLMGVSVPKPAAELPAGLPPGLNIKTE